MSPQWRNFPRRPAQSVEPEEGILLACSVERLEELRVRIGPDPLDGESRRIGDVVRPFPRIGAGHHEKLDVLGPEVG